MLRERFENSRSTQHRRCWLDWPMNLTYPYPLFHMHRCFIEIPLVRGQFDWAWLGCGSFVSHPPWSPKLTLLSPCCEDHSKGWQWFLLRTHIFPFSPCVGHLQKVAFQTTTLERRSGAAINKKWSLVLFSARAPIALTLSRLEVTSHIYVPYAIWLCTCCLFGLGSDSLGFGFFI